MVIPRTMFGALTHLPGTIRTFNTPQQLAASTREGVANAAQRSPRAKLVQYPYYIPRNTRGSLPVYSDIRNNGTRILVQIRNVEGNIVVTSLVMPLTKPTEWFPSFLQQLAQDVRAALLEKGSHNATRMKVTVKARQLVIQGGFWKNDIIEWLISKGF